MKKYIELLKTFWVYEALTSEVFVKRLKSFLWRSGSMLVIGLLDIAVQSLTDFNPDNVLTVLTALIVSEITKHLNTK